MPENGERSGMDGNIQCVSGGAIEAGFFFCMRRGIGPNIHESYATTYAYRLLIRTT